MNQSVRMNRRLFVIGSAAAGGGFVLGLKFPVGPDAAAAQASEPEVNAWVVIRPDETVVIRVAKSEMGQGTITGLAQLVAEELECDWSKVSIEYPTPGQNLAANKHGAPCSPPAVAASENRKNSCARAAPRLVRW
jgi:isoquinoline 1-oxidoreductase subunit beta